MQAMRDSSAPRPDNDRGHRSALAAFLRTRWWGELPLSRALW